MGIFSETLLLELAWLYVPTEVFVQAHADVLTGLGPQLPSNIVIMMQEQPETCNQDNREKGKQMQITDQTRKP